jgi:hypothetical protein
MFPPLCNQAWSARILFCQKGKSWANNQASGYIYSKHEYRIKCRVVVRLRRLGLWAPAAVAWAVVSYRALRVSIALNFWTDFIC